MCAACTPCGVGSAEQRGRATADPAQLAVEAVDAATARAVCLARTSLQPRGSGNHQEENTTMRSLHTDDRAQRLCSFGSAVMPNWLMLLTLASMVACGPLPEARQTSGAAGKSASSMQKAKSGGNDADGADNGDDDARNASSARQASQSNSAKASPAPDAGTAGDASAAGGSNRNGHAAMSGGANQADPASASSGASGADAGSMMKRRDPTTIDACLEKSDAFLCEGRKLYHCVDGNNAAPELCMTPARCDAGVMTGECGECDPGAFRCTGADLEACDETGRWMPKETCDSEKLCKATTGVCDTKVCGEGEYRCADDGALEVCNSELTDFEFETSCPAGLCNWEAERCNECMPEVVECKSEATLSTCSADGMEEVTPCGGDTPFCVEDACVQCRNDKDCSAESDNECGTRVCQAGKCAAGEPKPARTPCSGGICDYLGSCVMCITDSDCNDPMLRCLTGVACVNRNTIEATPSLLGGGWSVAVSAGYSVDISATAGVTYTVSSLLNSTTNTKTIGGSKTEARTYTLSVSGYSACGIVKVGRDLDRVTLDYAEMTEDGNGACRPLLTLTPMAL